VGTLEEIRDLLKRFTAGEIQTFPAEVLSVDPEAYTAIVKPPSDPELKVRLKAAVNEVKPGFVLIPKVGSTVLIALILNDRDSGYICAIDEVEQVEIRSESVVINEGANGGLIVHEQLLNEYDKTKGYLGTLKVATKAIATALDALVPGTSVAFDAAMESEELGDLSNITNTKVKH